MSRDADDSRRILLESFKTDIDRLDEKWDQYLVGMTRLEVNQHNMSIQVNKLAKLLTEDNGKPSIVSQIQTMTQDVHAIKQDLTQIKNKVGAKTPKEVVAERWKAAGLIGGGFLATIPGILSFIHSFM